MVDDGSDPPLELHTSEIKWLRNPKGVGMSAARNLGISRAAGQYVATFDDDVEISDTTLLSRSVALASKIPRMWCDRLSAIASRGAAHEIQPAAALVPCCTGHFFSYRRLLSAPALKRVGLYEPLFGFYCEEIEQSLWI